MGSEGSDPQAYTVRESFERVTERLEVESSIGNGKWVRFYKDGRTVNLDGYFSKREVRRIAEVMEE